MYTAFACVAHAMVLWIAWHWTDSALGFLVTGAGLMVLLDRYVLHLALRPTIAWHKELLLRGGWFVAGAVGFYLMRRGIVPLTEAAWRGLMFSLGAALFAQAVRCGRHGRTTWRPVPWLAVALLVLLIPLLPVVVGLHPLRTVPKRTPAAWGFAFEDVQIRTRDGVRLAAWLVPQSQPRGNVIFCHGHGRNRGHVAGHLQTLHDM